MNLTELWGLLNNFFQHNKRYVIITLIVLINIIGFLITNKNTYSAFIFYPDRNKTRLIKEKREILKNFNKIKRIENTVDELLLGPIAPSISDIYSKNSKLLSIRVAGKILFLNFNRDFIMDIEENSNMNDIYKIILQSVATTVCYQFKEIKVVRFFFEGREYKFLGTFGPIDQGVKPDFSILSN